MNYAKIITRINLLNFLEKDMNTNIMREQLHEQIDHLPDEVVQQIADFTYFVMSKKKLTQPYDDWDQDQWQQFALEQFFREEDEVHYSLDDAKEIFHP